MRVAYIVELDAYQASGVLSKIVSQVNIWNQLGADGKLFLVSKPPGGSNDIGLINNKQIWLHYSRFADLISRFIGRKQVYLNKIFTAISVEKKIKQYDPDVIYYRFGIWFPGQLKRFGNKPVVVEINSNDLDEFHFYDNLAFYINKFTRNKLLLRADGFCSVTEEIGKEIARKNKPCVVISNGVVITPMKKRLNSNNARAQVIFVGSSNGTWHGVDKIVRIAGLLPKYDFHIVGRNRNQFKELTTNVIFHNYLESNELSQLYGKMDIAIGTLALHRNNMIEASPLKVREYVAHGLPVIIGYKDTDLDGKSFILNIGNYEGNAVDNFQKISQFIESCKNINIEVDLKCIDMLEKEKQRLEFFKRFLG